MIYALGSARGNSRDGMIGSAGESVGRERKRFMPAPIGGPEIGGGQKLNVSSRRAVFLEGSGESVATM